MRFKTLNGYDVSLKPYRSKKYPEDFGITVSIHVEEHITTSYLLELNKQEVVDLINSLQDLLTEENNHV